MRYPDVGHIDISIFYLEKSFRLSFITSHVQCEQGEVIGVGALIYLIGSAKNGTITILILLLDPIKLFQRNKMNSKSLS